MNRQQMPNKPTSVRELRNLIQRSGDADSAASKIMKLASQRIDREMLVEIINNRGSNAAFQIEQMLNKKN